MPGPAPKPDDQRRRRNATMPTTRLPAEGRKGRAPAWPLSRATAAESKFWQEIWKTPQATAWERLGWTRTVARYARLAVAAEEPRAQATICSEARQLEDRLGLTPMSMLRLRWEVVPNEVAEARQDREAAKQAPARRARLKAVDPKGA